MYIQGGSVSRGLKCFFFIGSHVLLKLLLGLKSMGLSVLGCWLTIYSIQFKLRFLSGGRMAAAE